MTTFSDLTLTAGGAWLTEWNALISRLTSFTGAFEGIAALSASSVAIGTGTKAFVLTATSPFAVGAVVRARSAANSANYMVGTVTVSDGTDLSISVASGYTGGSGTIADWIISASWDGAATIANGLATADVDMAGYELVTDLTQYATADAGNSGTATHTVAKTSLDFQSITATGDFTIDVTAPDAGQILSKRRRVVMDGTGARDVTVTRDGGSTLIFWPQNTSDATVALDTTAYAAGAIFDLWFEHDGTRLVVHYELIYAGA